jgi:bifunctional UDP-N-acetylglucosamine pyrophosphorylase/glucosamine-1-phosphate N-acetyltransferase
MRNQIVILAAGKGTRMGQNDMPKVLVMLKQKPIILYLLGELEKINQLAKPVVVVGYKYNQVKSVLGEGFTYAFQDQQLGTAHAVMCAERQVTADNILVLYGDMPFIKAESLKKLMRLHHEQKSNLSMFTSVVNNFEKHASLNGFGRIIRDVYGNIIKITEYKDASGEERKIREVNPGIYMFNSKWLWDNIAKISDKNAQREYYLTDIVEVAIARGENIYSLNINPSEVAGINSPEELVAAELLLNENMLS